MRKCIALSSWVFIGRYTWTAPMSKKFFFLERNLSLHPTGLKPAIRFKMLINFLCNQNTLAVCYVISNVVASIDYTQSNLCTEDREGSAAGYFINMFNSYTYLVLRVDCVYTTSSEYYTDHEHRQPHRHPAYMSQ